MKKKMAEMKEDVFVSYTTSTILSTILCYRYNLECI